MINGEIIYTGKVPENGILFIDLNKHYPLGKVVCNDLSKIEYMFMEQWETLEKYNDFENETARYVKVFAKSNSSVEIYLGLGYYAEDMEEYTEEFFKKSKWTGGDGIFSFNINDGNDSFDQSDAKTLFVFGDTLVGYVSEKDYQRTEPVLMPNNTIAYLEGNDPIEMQVEFKINTNKFDSVISYFEPSNCSIYAGTIPTNLLKYDPISDNKFYLSGYDPKQVVLVFDLEMSNYVKEMELSNFFIQDQEIYDMSRRGIKQTTIYTSHDGIEYELLKKHTFTRASLDNLSEFVAIEKECRFIKLVVSNEQGIGNHYLKTDNKEVCFAINKVKFHTDKHLLRDVSVNGTSYMSKEKPESWFWLQDGVVIENDLYFLPLLVGIDLTKPEGLQFQVLDVSMIKVPIKNKELDFNNQVQKPTPLCYTTENSQWLFGCAFMSNTVQAGAINPNGYIYIYGYETVKLARRLKVARVKPETFSLFDTWEFYADGIWQDDLLKSSTLLDHISCEMSVTQITTGENKGKYIAVFSYDVNTTYVAYSIGETPVGPFSSPTIVHHSSEKARLGKTAYAYNAKAHPHLSKSNEIIVTYNMNTYSMDHNVECADVYHPRFIKLIDTSKE